MFYSAPGDIKPGYDTVYDLSIFIDIYFAILHTKPCKQIISLLNLNKLLLVQFTCIFEIKLPKQYALTYRKYVPYLTKYTGLPGPCPLFCVDSSHHFCKSCGLSAESSLVQRLPTHGEICTLGKNEQNNLKFIATQYNFEKTVKSRFCKNSMSLFVRWL